MFNFRISLLLIFSFSQMSLARTILNTQCTKSSSNANIEGININIPYTIASVSKIFNSHWALARLGPKYRFPTKLHLTPISKNLYDLHVEGSLFPYFDKTMYQFLVGELNKLGVRQINNLTYDENFLYSTNIRTSPTLAHGNDDQDTIEIMRELRRDTIALNEGLAALNAKALAVENLQLPKTLSIRINDIHYLDRTQFQPNDETVSFSFHSSELYRNLKEMNRNSNNFVADRLFRRLSKNENYLDFILSRLVMLRADEIKLYNGSGFPVFINSNKVYNEASCAAIIEMMADLKQSLLNAGLDIKDVMSVAGKDSVEDGNSTVTQIYGSELTAGTLIAKTGSVLDTVALAGLVVTANENIYFQTSFNIDNNPEDRATAYAKIKEWLANELIKDKKKSDLNSYQPKVFLPFDGRSQLKRIDSFKRLN